MTMKELESCIDAYGNDIYNFCLHLTKDRELAEELYQDTFLTAVEILGRIENKENPKSYFLSISVRLWKNKKRKWAWRSRIAPISEVEDSFNKNFSYVESNTILKEEQTIVLRKAIEGLSEKYRVVVLLHYLEELTLEEMSKVLHVPTGTIKSRLYTARQLLKSELEEYFHE